MKSSSKKPSKKLNATNKNDDGGFKKNNFKYKKNRDIFMIFEMTTVYCAPRCSFAVYDLQVK